MDMDMDAIDELIRTTSDARVVKRALAIKMLNNGLPGQQISHILNVSEQYVSKWKGIYINEGASGLNLGYKGRPAYLMPEERQDIIAWIQAQKTISLDDVIAYVEEQYGVIYQSKQSYYDLLAEGGMSYHKTTLTNPKRNEDQIEQKREEIKKKLADNRDAIEQGEIVVLAQDESHLVWGDVCGLVWGKRNEPIEVDVANKRLRQTYYGAVNLQTHQFHLKEYDRGNAINTVDYIKFLQSIYPTSKIWLLWDGASYHRFAETRDYLAEINEGLSEKDWLVNCILFAPNAPEQNPVEDIWLKGKNWLRKNFAQNKTFVQVKHCFSSYLKDKIFDSEKFSWYIANPQLT